METSRGAVVITGGTSGIGRAIARCVIATGFRSVVLTRGAAAETVDHSNKMTPAFVRSDLSAPKAAASALEGALQRLSDPLVGLILCAATYGKGPRHDLASSTVEEWDQIISTNLASSFELIKVALPVLRRAPSSFILGISSRAAIESSPGRAIYSAAKAGQAALLAALSDELEGSPVSVVQMFPQDQVATPGLARRRPPGFAFEGYSRPEIFDKPVMNCLAVCGAGLNGSVLMVGSDGSSKDVRSVFYPNCHVALDE